MSRSELPYRRMPAMLLAQFAPGRRLLPTVVASFGLRFGSLFLRFVLAVLLARYLGARDYGVYSFALAMVMVLAVPVQLGLPGLVVRETAKAQAGGEWSLMRALWRWSFLVILAFSVAVIGLAVLVLHAWPVLLPEAARPPVYAGLLLIPLYGLGAVRSAALRGLRRIVPGQLPDAVILPLVFLALVAALRQLRAIDSVDAMCAHLAAAAVAWGAGVYMLQRARPPESLGAVSAATRPAGWLGSVFTLALLSGLQLINKQADILMLGFMRSAPEVGVYRVANSAVVLTLVALQVVTAVISPWLARLHVQGDQRQLERLVTRASRFIFAVSMPVIAVYLLWGGQLLGWVFGADYSGGAPVLKVLSIAQAVNVCAGPVGVLLTMTGHERLTLRGVLAATLVNVILNALLIPPYGVVGAAVATGLSVICWNVLLCWFAWRRLGIDTTLLGRHRSRENTGS